MNNYFDHGDSTINPKLVDEKIENIIITNSKPFQIKKCNGKKATFKSYSLFNLKKLRCKTLLYKKRSTIKNKEENANTSVVSSQSSNNKTIYNNDSVKYTSNVCYICSSLSTNNIRNNDYCTIY